jgi:hypothetical protein
MPAVDAVTDDLHFQGRIVAILNPKVKVFLIPCGFLRAFTSTRTDDVPGIVSGTTCVRVLKVLQAPAEFDYFE